MSEDQEPTQKGSRTGRVESGRDSWIVGTLNINSGAWKTICNTSSLGVLLYSGLKYLTDLEAVGPVMKSDLLAELALRLVLSAIFAIPLVISSHPLDRLMSLLQQALVATPEHFGVASGYFLCLAILLSAIWFFISDAQARRAIADGIKFTIGAVIGSAVAHRTPIKRCPSGSRGKE